MKNHLGKGLLILFIVSSLLTSAQSSLSVKENIEIGSKYTFHSKVLDETRELWIRVPTGYITDDTTKYPVVYLLDGNNNFLFTAGLLRQLENRSVPKSILVGVLNTNRSRDLTPPASEKEPDSGGADQFLEMFEKELIPNIESQFRTNQFRTIIGHSYGGLFAVYALAKKPALFDAYLAISPSLWWDEQKIVSYFEKRLKENQDLKAMLYLTMASERGQMLGGMLKLAGILESEAPKNLRWDFKVHPNEHHGSIPTISTLEGFHFFYKDWHIPVKEFENYGLEVLTQRKDRIKKEFGNSWTPKNIIYTDILWDFVESGKFDETIKLSEQLLASGNKAVDFHETAAIAYKNLSKLDKAKYHFSEMYKLNPGYKDGADMLDSLGIDKSTLLPSPTLNIKDLQKYVGFYSDGENECTVEIENGSLKILLKEPYFTINKGLKVFKEHQFYVPDNYYVLAFQFKDNVELASHLKVVETTGWSNTMVRIK